MWTFPNVTRCTSPSTWYIPAQYQMPLPQKEGLRFFNMIVAKTHARPTEACKNERKISVLILNSNPGSSQKISVTSFDNKYHKNIYWSSVVRAATQAQQKLQGCCQDRLTIWALSCNMLILQSPTLRRSLIFVCNKIFCLCPWQAVMLIRCCMITG